MQAKDVNMGNERTVSIKLKKEGWHELKLSDGSVEAIKWLAVLCMTIDHLNWFLLYPATGVLSPVLYNIGRVAFPLFALLIAYNLARPRTNDNERRALLSALKRLLIFGVLSIYPYYLASSGITVPLNIMFALGLSVGLIYCLRIGADKKNRLARYSIYFFTHAIFALLAGLVEYSHYGAALIVSAWLLFRYESAIALLATLTFVFSLQAINVTPWALAAIPIFILGSVVEIKLPRVNKYVFYAYYPLHLLFITGIAAAYKAFYL